MDHHITLSPANRCEPTRGDLLAQVAALHGKLASLAAIEQANGAFMVPYGEYAFLDPRLSLTAR